MGWDVPMTMVKRNHTAERQLEAELAETQRLLAAAQERKSWYRHQLHHLEVEHAALEQRYEALAGLLNLPRVMALLDREDRENLDL